MRRLYQFAAAVSRGARFPWQYLCARSEGASVRFAQGIRSADGGGEVGIQVLQQSERGRAVDEGRSGVRRRVGWELHRTRCADGQRSLARSTGRGGVFGGDQLSAGGAAVRGDSRRSGFVLVCAASIKVVIVLDDNSQVEHSIVISLLP